MRDVAKKQHASFSRCVQASINSAVMRLDRPVDADAVRPVRDMLDGHLSIAHLAHELNSLLDGSMRCLSLAQQAIDDHPNEGGSDAAHVAARIKTARCALDQMADLLRRAMQSNAADLSIFADAHPLEAHVQQVVELISPMAAEHGVHIAVDMTPRAASLPAGMLGPVILNGMRNAIQACAASVGERRVELTIALNPADELQLFIADTGPGASDDPCAINREHFGGHGFGLDLARRIVEQLGGDLRLTNVPFGGGAVLQATVPMRRLPSP